MKVRLESAGMTSCMGPLVTACAAFRAGMTRAQSTLDFEYFTREDNAPRALKACEIPLSTYGFSATGRLVVIACEMLQDLWSRTNMGLIARDTPLLLALPDPLEFSIPMAPGLENNEAKRVGALGKRVLSQAFSNMGYSWSGGDWEFFSGGHIAFAHALKRACELLTSRLCRSCIVAALDSRLHPDFLEQLLLEERLKTEDNPVGFIPGEAGIAVLLTTSATSTSDSKRPGILVRSVATLEEQEENSAPGERLHTCIQEALRPALPIHEPVLISDHNGEPRRATEWGALLARLRASNPEWSLATTWFPATGFGDIGTASGAIALCLAARSLERRYAPSRDFLIVSSSDFNAKAAVVLSAHP